MPLITVIIPTFNRATLVGATVRSALDQDFSDYEVIVVDDGSTDDTQVVLATFGDKIRVLKHENSGLGASRNYGLREARGEYVALLDDDDIWFPWTLSVYATAICENQSPWLVSSRGVDFINAANLPTPPTGELIFRFFKDFYSSSGLSYWATPSGVAFRTEEARGAGGFFEHPYGQEENDLWLRMGDKKGFVIIDKPVCFGRRIHDMNISSFSNRNLLGTRYIIDQELSAKYPGIGTRDRERRDILTSHIRGVSLSCIRLQHHVDAWELYRRTFRWHVELKRWRYLLAFPLLSWAKMTVKFFSVTNTTKL